MAKPEDHRQAILDQFTRQAGPFLKKLRHADESVFRLLFEAAGVTSEGDKIYFAYPKLVLVGKKF
jgi:hypothetical protein